MHAPLRRGQNRPTGCQRFPDLEPAVCELTSEGNIVVAKQSLADMSFGAENLGMIVVDNRDLYFVTRQGKTAPALKFDNGPDYFVEGLARTVKKRKSRLHRHRTQSSGATCLGLRFPLRARSRRGLHGMRLYPSISG
jgi:hypothetical protein